jgi:probable F420-dependent oxidoreductase
MHIGVVFPQTEIGSDPTAVRDYAQAAEELGYTHLLAYDHVLGADTQHHEGWVGTYTSHHLFHEPFTLFSYMAAITERLQFVTGILILPQRQTALVAKQTAEVDVLTGGRLRLGIGIGWNHVEYEALGENFKNRGRRCEEQIDVLRALWTQEVVNYEGEWHHISHAGINPLPVQRPIPIWFGAGRSSSPIPVEAVMRRVARLGDGWFPSIKPDDTGHETIARLHDYAREAGRDPANIGLEARINLANGSPDAWGPQAEAWRGLGATHLSVNTMNADLGTPDAHIQAIRQFKDAIGV